MDLLLLIAVCVFIGFVVYLLTAYVPMPPYWARALQAVALVIVLLYLLSRFLPLPNVLPR